MSENIIQHANGTIILNGGDPLPGCPTDWDHARKWEEEANKDKKEYEEPRWSWDCGFKLDFDGPILRVSSRFYPPRSHYGQSWDGTVTIYILGNKVETKKFDCATLDELQKHVERYIKSIAQRIAVPILGS